MTFIPAISITNNLHSWDSRVEGRKMGIAAVTSINFSYTGYSYLMAIGYLIIYFYSTRPIAEYKQEEPSKLNL